MHAPYICKKCYQTICGFCYGDAFTSYMCNQCGKWKSSGSTHNPKFCCNECSEKMKCCEECGLNDIISDEEKRTIQKAYWKTISHNL